MKTFPIAWKIINLQINQSMVKFFSMFDFLICFMMTLKFYCYGLSVLEIVHLSAKSPEAVKENTKEETQKSWAVMSSVQFSSVAQSCPTPCNPMDCSTPGLPVHYQLLELAQTPVHQVGDAIQPSYPLSTPSLPAFNFSQHQGLCQ